MSTRSTLLTLGCLLLMLAGGASLQAKSLYVIANINASPTPVQAYDLIGNTLVYQATYYIPYSGWGAVGIAIDSDNEFLFVTYEQSSTIQVVNAKTMTGVGTVIASGASNLAGIVYDHDASKLYVVDRNTKNLYVYSWNPSGPSLSLDGIHSLSQLGSAHGLALDEINDKLYIGDLTTQIKAFNTGDWSYAGSVTVSQKAMSVAVDVTNNILYSGNAYSGYGSLGLLCKYDMNTDTETTVSIGALTEVSGDNVVGLAVDPATGLLYATTGDQGYGGSDRVLVMDQYLALLNGTGDIGDPTGVAVPGKNISYNPLDLTASDGLDYGLGECVQPGGQISYTITYDNLLNAYQVDNVTISATLNPLLTWVSGGTHSAGTVTWNIGTLPANDPGGTLALVVDVSSGATPGNDIDQLFTIVGDQTGPSSVTETTLICPNQPPVAVCNDVQLFADANCEGYVTAEVVGAGSYDPDGDPMTYTLSPAPPYPLGVTPVTLTVSDGMYSDACNATVTVLDNTPPVITLITSPIELWPPNHEYTTVAVGDFVQSVSDNCDNTLTVADVSILRVESDEPENDIGIGDGNTMDDMLFGSTCTAVDLRKERAGSLNGRVYRIHVGLTDASGNFVQSFFDVAVKHDPDQPAAIWDGANWSVSCGAAKSVASSLPDGFALEQNYPNPFNDMTVIPFTLTQAGPVTLQVYDIHGRLLRTLVNETRNVGTYTIPFRAASLPSGMYVYRLEANGVTRTRLMQHIK